MRMRPWPGVYGCLRVVPESTLGAARDAAPAPVRLEARKAQPSERPDQAVLRSKSATTGKWSLARLATAARASSWAPTPQLTSLSARSEVAKM